MSDFRETLEVSKNSTCFLSFSWCRTKEDLFAEEDDALLEVEFEQDASVSEVAELLDTFCETAGKATDAITALLNNGKVTVVEEY